jgi:RNA polymerase sigma-70 factor (ECF subfamily)
MDEVALIESARSDPDAFARLYDLTQPSVYRFALSLATDHHRAEELTAEAYRRALVHLPRYEHRGRPFVAWLCTIVRNLQRDHGRRKGRETPLLDHDCAVDEWPGDGLVRIERSEVVRKALTRLAPVQRRVVVLRFGHEKSCREIGDELGKSEAAVKQLTYRAVARLREILEADGYEYEG